MIYQDDPALTSCQRKFLQMLQCCENGKINFDSKSGRFGWANLQNCINVRETFLTEMSEEQIKSMGLRQRIKLSLPPQEFTSMEIDCSGPLGGKYSLKVCCLRLKNANSVRICKDCISFLFFDVTAILFC